MSIGNQKRTLAGDIEDSFPVILTRVVIQPSALTQEDTVTMSSVGR